MTKNELGGEVENYYLAHIDELNPSEQFHFLSRLYLWKGTPFARQRLADLFDDWANLGGSITEKLRTVAAAKASYNAGSSNSPINSLALRKPYLDTYPTLRLQGNVLSRIHFLRVLYDIDETAIFPELFTAQESKTLFDALLNDRTATAILATYAVNFLYFYNHSYGEKMDLGNLLLDFPSFLEGTDDIEKIQIYIYFYTHCIIGEAGFYSRPINQKESYLKMLERLERVIGKHYDKIHLDNKFEYLVSCRLLGITSPIEERIYTEATNSLSHDGTFLIDRHNSNPQVHRTRLGNSEHRNVLFLMSLTNPIYNSEIVSISDAL